MTGISRWCPFVVILITNILSVAPDNSLLKLTGGSQGDDWINTHRWSACRRARAPRAGLRRLLHIVWSLGIDRRERRMGYISIQDLHKNQNIQQDIKTRK